MTVWNLLCLVALLGAGSIGAAVLVGLVWSLGAALLA